MFQPKPLATPVVGFRSWQQNESFKIGIGKRPELRAINPQYGAWKPGVNHAVCYRGMEYASGGFLHYSLSPSTLHAAPQPDCACGFYVLTDLDKVPWEWGSGLDGIPTHGVVGAVVGWGRVVQHGDEGWRAEKVQVIAMLDTKLSDEHLAITQRVAEAYGVPVVGRTALELMANEYGEPLRLPAHVETA